MSEEALAYAVHDDPNDPLTFLYYGSALLKSGNASTAESAFQRAVELDPHLARAYDGLGSAQMRLGKIKSANDAFQQAVKLDPRDAAGYLGVSQSYYQAGSAHRAIDPLKKLVDLEPKNAVAWYHLGRLYGEDHQADQAYAALQKAVALDSKNSDYLRDLAHLSMHYGKMRDAETQLKAALKLAPRDPVANFWLGQVYAQAGDNPQFRGQAEQEFLIALSQDPNLADAHFELGQLYERRKNYTLAESNFRKAFELNSSDDRSLYHLGTCLVNSGFKAEGQAKIRGAEELAASKKELQDLQNRSLAEPQNPEMHLRLARVWRKYGNDEGAAKEYRSYKLLGPPDPKVEKEADAFIESFQKSSASSASAGGTR